MRVLVFNHGFFNISETFVYKQVTGMPADIEISLMGFEFLNPDKFPTSQTKYPLRRYVNKADRLIGLFQRRFFSRNTGFSPLNTVLVNRILLQEKFDVIHAHFGFNALIIYPLAKKLNIPLVVTFHGVDASPEYLNRKGYKKAVDEMLAYASAIIIVSPHMVNTLGISHLENKTFLIPCCVDPTEFMNTEHQRNIPLKILHSGRLISKKGVPDLIKVCNAIENIELNIIGDGPELETCKQLAAGKKYITFHGAQPHEEVKKFMAGTDIFVLNSRVGDTGDMEGMPVSVLEAMSMQLAIVSTYHAGIPMAIDNDVEGLLVEEKNNDQLLAALKRLINDAQLRTRLGNAARSKVERRFTIEQMNDKIEGVYRSIAGNKLVR